MELEFQGAIIRQEAFDMQCSQEIYKNNSLADKLVKFVTKARLQIAETNTFLHLCYPNSYQKEVSKMQQPKRNHVTRAEWMYVARHNRIVKLIGEQIAADKLDLKIHCEKIVKLEMFVNESEISDQSFSFQWVNHRRPDLLLVNKAKKKAFIVEFSVPFDRFIDLCYQHKFNKYIELCNKCNELGYHTRIIVLIIGSLGLVHNKFVNGLKVIGLTTSKAKAIAKYVSVSARIGSYVCWSSRMRK